MTSGIEQNLIFYILYGYTVNTYRKVACRASYGMARPGHFRLLLADEGRGQCYLVLVEEHVKLSHADTQVCLVELVRVVPAERAELAPFLHVGVEETEPVEHALPGTLLAARREELGVRDRVTQVRPGDDEKYNHKHENNTTHIISRRSPRTPSEEKYVESAIKYKVSELNVT